jgi:hypothetical protein
MSDVKISQLPSASSAANNAVLPIVASGTTSQLTIANLAGSLPQVTSSISASFANNATSASYALTASFALNAGGAINTGSFATTGSNTFKGDQTISGSITVTNTIKGTGSLILQPDANDVRYLQVYNTSPTDTHITASGGQLFIGDDITYVKVDNYGSVKHIDIVADNGTNILGSVQITGSLDVTSGITGSLQGTASFATNATSASFATNATSASFATNARSASFALNVPISVLGSTLYSNNPLAGTNFNRTGSIIFGTTAGVDTPVANDSIFMGEGAGGYATNASYSNFSGYYAGFNATNASYANLIGYNAGNGATNALQSNFIGRQAGQNAASSAGSNFIGTSAGQNASNAGTSNFIGNAAGQGATYAQQSNFIGDFAGDQATLAEQSNFIGRSAGQGAASSSFSNLIGWQAGKRVSGAGIGANNIIIGTNITLENNRRDSINLGGVIFATGSYAYDPFNLDPFSGSMTNAKVGINKSLPNYTLDISGSLAASSFVVLTAVSQSLNFVDDAAAATGGVPLGGLYRSGSFVLIRTV